ARVIFFVDWTERIRRRYWRSLAPKALLLLLLLGAATVLVLLAAAVAAGLLGTLAFGGLLLALVGPTTASGGDLLLVLLALHRLGGVVHLAEPGAGRGLELLLEVGESPLERLDRVLGELTALHDRLEHALLRVADVVEKVALEPADVLHRHVVELAARAGPDRHDLALDGVGRVLRLLEQLDQPGAALELRLRRLV